MRSGKIIAPLRLRSIHPPPVKSEIEQSFIDIAPKEFPRPGVEGIVRCVGRFVFYACALIRVHACILKSEQKAPGIHGIINIGSLVDTRPDGNDGMRILPMKILHHGFGIRIAARIKDVRPPQIVRELRPVVGILHDDIERNLSFPITVDHALDLFLRFPAILTHKQAVSPFRIERRFAGDRSYVGNDPIRFRTVHKIVIDRVGDLRCERHTARHFRSPAGEGNLI